MGNGQVPQGMLQSSLGPQRVPVSPPARHGGHLGPMSQGVAPLNAGIQAPVHYMGYYPPPYFAAQSAGELPIIRLSTHTLSGASTD